MIVSMFLDEWQAYTSLMMLSANMQLLCDDIVNAIDINTVDDPVLLDNPIPREKLQEHGIALPQSFVRLDAEVEALLMCLSKEAIA